MRGNCSDEAHWHEGAVSSGYRELLMQRQEKNLGNFRVFVAGGTRVQSEAWWERGKTGRPKGVRKTDF